MNLKKEFELSLWEDFMDNKTKPGISFINEQKICTIASDTLEHPSTAYNIYLKSKTDGTHELTFDITYRYWDQFEQAFVENPFRKYLYNEAKVKLKYKNKWYDFIIKSCQENSQDKKFSYVCKDLYIDELGRNGYSAEFATSLGNNVGDVVELASAALEGSDWVIAPFEKSSNNSNNYTGPYSDIPIQKTEEAVYSYTLRGDKEIVYGEINEKGELVEGGKITSTEEDWKTIFVLYNCANNENLKGIDYQFYYNPDGYYKTDDDNFFIETNPKYIISTNFTEEEKRIPYSSATHTFIPSYRAHRYVRAQKTEWLDKIGKRVTCYDRGENKEESDYNFTHYGYVKTSYLSPEIAQNILINTTLRSNSNGDYGIFDGTSGWEAFSEDGDTEYQIRLGGTYGYDTETGETTLGGIVYLQAYEINDKNETIDVTDNITFNNLALQFNLKNIGALTKGEKWVYRTINNGQPLYCEELFNTKAQGSIILPDDNYTYYFYETKTSKTYKELQNTDVKFSFVGKNGCFHGGELFRCYTYINEDGQEVLITPESQNITNQNLIKNEYYYFTPAAYEACTSENDLKLEIIEDNEPKSETYCYYENFKKIGTLETKESNYFNIIQTLNEKFECWADFQIAHEDNGRTLVDSEGNRIKQVIFKNYIGNDNWAGFKYGINLDSIQRSIDSAEITTKTIVKANSNEFAKNGTCNISRAPSNPSGSQAIINLDYFCKQGILKENEVRSDLYLEDNGYLGYYTKLKRYNNAIQLLEAQLIALDNSIREAEIKIQSNDVNEEDFTENILSVNEKLSNTVIGFKEGKYTSSTIQGVTYYKPNSDDDIIYATNIFYKDESHPLINENGIKIYGWAYKSPITFYYFYSSNEGYKKNKPSNLTQYNLTNGIELVNNYNEFVKQRYYGINEKRDLEKEKGALITRRDGKYSYIDVDGEYQEYKYKYVLKDNKGVVYKVTEDNRDNENFLDNDIIKEFNYNNSSNPIEEPLSIAVRKLEKQFYSKYYRFIREGIWTSEEYVDDELYYLDACNVSYTSAFPKISYSISVSDIKNSIIPEELGYDYSGYDFNCGDRTTIEDPEFFGWVVKDELGKDIPKTPYKELVLISETNEHLDGLDGDTIIVQNYKTQFDDLFQRIAATTQSLELKQGQYDKATKIVDINGNIDEKLLAQSLSDNNAIISNAGAQGTEVGSKGIRTWKIDNPACETRMVSGGIVITEDGKNWITGISGKGVNATSIKTGNLDVSKVTIWNNGSPSFCWTKDGINAYVPSINGGYNLNKYVRFNNEGIKGQNGEHERFSLNWNGFSMNDDTGNPVFQWNTETQQLDIVGKIRVSGDSTSLDEQLGKVGLQIQDLQNQIDGNISSWFYEGEPTLENLPAKDWTDDNTKNAHLGDLYYDQLTGNCYRFSFNSNQEKYEWILVTDTDVSEALAAANRAQATADGKMTVFTNTPTVPYGVGDLWINLENNEKTILYSTVSKGTEDTYARNDWVSAADYVAISTYNTFVTGYNSFASTIQSQVDRKAQTWYQLNDPSNDWDDEVDGGDYKGKHVGDLWKYTGDTTNTEPIRKKNAEYIYKESGTNQYSWVEMEVPDEVFDAIDGTADIYTSWPTDATKKQKLNDILIPSADFKKNNKEFKQGKIYKSTTDNAVFNGNYWTEVAYTDDSATEDLKKEVDAFNQKVNKTLDIKETEIGGDYIISPKIGGGYLNITSGSGTSTKKVIIDPKNMLKTNQIFQVYNNNQMVIGLDENGNGVFKGKITATEGQLGSWTLTGTHIYASVDGYYTYITVPGKTTTGAYYNVFAAGGNDEKNRDKYPFRVTADGRLFATAGKIGGWNIEQTGISYDGGTSSKPVYGRIRVGNDYDYLRFGTTDDGDNANFKGFRVDNQGGLHATSAEISGKIIAKAGSEIAGWEVTAHSLQKTYNGKTTGIQIPSNQSKWAIAVGAPVREDGAWVDAPFKVSHDGELYASNATISGTIEAKSIVLTETFTNEKDEKDGTKLGNFYFYYRDVTDGRYFSTASSSNLMFSGNNAYISMEADSSSDRGYNGYAIRLLAKGTLPGSHTTGAVSTGILITPKTGNLYTSSNPYTEYNKWTYNNSDIETTDESDIKLKHSVQNISYQYEQLFDKLRPVTYIYHKNDFYNLGTSQRTHIGLIANEVEQSLYEVGLTTQQLAAYRIENENGIRSLKYKEFISLNTWQIQKLKTRVTELENEIQSLKQKLS